MFSLVVWLIILLANDIHIVRPLRAEWRGSQRRRRPVSMGSGRPLLRCVKPSVARAAAMKRYAAHIQEQTGFFL
jgi:hypothetical protein